MTHSISSSFESQSDAWMTWRDVFLQYAQPMLAVVLLLRFSSIVDEAGFAFTLLLVFVTFLISIVTGWSACTVVSRKNAEGTLLKTMTSYSTPQFATSFSLLYMICLILATSLFINAGAEALIHVISTFSVGILDGASHDLRLVSSIISIIVLPLTLIRIKQARSIRGFVFTLTIIAVGLHLSGVMFRYGEYQLQRVSTKNQLVPSPPIEENATIFAQLFPASICALSILNFGGTKLQSSAPRGSLLAIAICAAVYGGAAMLDYVEFFARSGNTTTNLQNEHQAYIYTTVPMALVICLACIVSAVTTLKYSSVIFQDLCRCCKQSRINWLATGYGNRLIPIRCLLLISIVQILISLIGSYDIICIPTTVFFLIAYAIFNFYVFLVKLSNDHIPSPPAAVSLLVSALCVFCALYTNRHFALLSTAIFAFYYCGQLYLEKKRSSMEHEESVRLYTPVLEQMHKLQQEPENDRHYHPQILLLTGNPAVRPALVDFANSITRGKSLLITGYVIPQTPCSRSYLLQLKIDKQMNDWLRARRIDAFGSAICCANQSDGANILLQTVGLGRLRPNILMVGFKTNWDKSGIENLTVVNEYFGMLSNAFEKQVGVIIFRNEIAGFDVSSSLRKNGAPIEGDEDLADFLESQTQKVSFETTPDRQMIGGGGGGQKGKLLSSMQTTFRKMSMAATKDVESGAALQQERHRFEVIARHSISEPDQAAVMAQMFRFRNRVNNARIDVYWLRESGGLTMLIPYLLSQAGSYLEGAHIRVFTKTEGKDHKGINEEQKGMAAVLRKFEIDSSNVHILPEFSKAPSREITEKFNKLINPFKVPRGVDKLPGMFDEDQLFDLREKTRNYLRAAELITEHSSEADLIVCTLPSARPKIPSALYLSWIEILSKQRPPVCLIRGNQVSIGALRLKFP